MTIYKQDQQLQALHNSYGKHKPTGPRWSAGTNCLHQPVHVSQCACGHWYFHHSAKASEPVYGIDVLRDAIRAHPELQEPLHSYCTDAIGIQWPLKTNWRKAMAALKREARNDKRTAKDT